MNTSNFSLIVLGLFGVLTLNLGCSGTKAYDGISTPVASTSYHGQIIVTSITTEPSTGPGIASLWSSGGVFISTLRDYFSTGEWASGSAFISPDQILLLIGNGTRIEKLNLSTSINTNFYVGTRLNGTPNRSLVRSTVDGSVYASEQTANTIEKFDANGNPIGAPFIGTTVTTGALTCTLATPLGMAFIPTNENVAVLNTARLNIYAKDGTCVGTVTTAPFSTNAPTAIAYHAQTDKLLVVFATSHAVYACSPVGTGCVQIYLNSAVINTPKAIATDSDGAIYVGSSGTDAIEKLSWTGTGNAVRSLTGSLIGPSVFTQNPTAITVIE